MLAVQASCELIERKTSVNTPLYSENSLEVTIIVNSSLSPAPSHSGWMEDEAVFEHILLVSI